MTSQDIKVNMAAVPEMTAQVMVQLGRMEEKQDNQLQSQNKFEIRIMDKHYKTEGRMTAAEKEIQNQATRIELLEAEKEALKEANKVLRETIATEINTVKKSLPEKVKLGAWLTGLATVMTIVMVFANLTIMTENKQEQSIQFEILKQNQKEINEKVEP